MTDDKNRKLHEHVSNIVRESKYVYDTDAFHDAVKLCFEECVANGVGGVGLKYHIHPKPPDDPHRAHLDELRSSSQLACLAKLREEIVSKYRESTFASDSAQAYLEVLGMIDAMIEELKQSLCPSGKGE